MAAKQKPSASNDLFAPPSKDEIASLGTDDLFAAPSEEELKGVSQEQPKALRGPSDGLADSMTKNVLLGGPGAALVARALGVDKELGVVGRSAAESASLGLSEPLISGARALAGQTEKAISEGDISQLLGDKLRAAYDADVEGRRKEKADNFGLDVSGQVVGALVPSSIAAKAGDRLVKGARGAAKAFGIGADAAKGAGLLARTGAGVGKIAAGAIEGGAAAAGLTGAQNAVLRESGFLKDGEGQSVGEAAAFGGKLGAGLSALPYAGKALAKIAPGLGKKALSTLFGPKVDDINTYLARSEEIKNAKSVEEIKNQIDDVMAGLMDDVAKGKLSIEEGREAQRIVDQQIREITQDAKFKFRTMRADVDEQLRLAKNEMEQAFKGEIEQLRAVKSPIFLSDDVQTSVQDLKKQITKGSEESYGILDRDPEAYSVRGAGKILRAQADEMDIQPFDRTAKTPESAGGLVNRVNFGEAAQEASRPITGASRGVQAELRSFAQMLEDTPQMVPARELKKMIQQIDASEKAMYGQPGFDTRVQQAYKMVRAAIDDAIKTKNVDYRDKMAEVAEKMRVLDQTLERFSTPQSTVSRLNQIAGRTAGADRELLESLGKATGRDFATPIDEFTKAQGLLKDPARLDELRNSLPQSKELARVEQAKAHMMRPESQVDFVDAEVAKSGLLGKKELVGKGLLKDEAALEAAESRLKPVRGLGPMSSQGAVKGLLKAPGKENIEIRKQLEHLGKMSEKDFARWIDDRRVADAFSGEFRHGSRNVNLWSLMSLAGAGAVSGGLQGAAISTALGATAGAVVDRFGPKMAQRILDGVIKIKGAPTVQKINQLDLPPEAKQYLQRALIEFQGANDRGQGLLAR